MGWSRKNVIQVVSQIADIVFIIIDRDFDLFKGANGIIAEIKQCGYLC